MYQSRIQSKKKRSGRFQRKREIEFPSEANGTQFGIVKDMLGNGRVRVFCEDGTLKVGRIRGSMRRSRGKTIIDKNDLVIVAPRDFEDKLDIIHKYTAEEVAHMVRQEELPEKIYKNLTESEFCRTEGVEDTIVFCEQPDQPQPEGDGSSSEDGESSSEGEDEELDIDAI